MTKLTFSVAAMLLASSSAFAGCAHGAYDLNQPHTATSATAGASTLHAARPKGVDTKATTGPSHALTQTDADVEGPPILGI